MGYNRHNAPNGINVARKPAFSILHICFSLNPSHTDEALNGSRYQTSNKSMAFTRLPEDKGTHLQRSPVRHAVWFTTFISASMSRRRFTILLSVPICPWSVVAAPCHRYFQCLITFIAEINNNWLDVDSSSAIFPTTYFYDGQFPILMYAI